jgi:Flp pilus assembly protein TadD
MAVHGQSTPRRCWIALVATIVIAGGCASHYVTDTDRLQAQAAYEQGTRALGKKEWAPAVTLLNRATTLDPEVAVYRNAFGIALLQIGQPQTALEQFRKATQIDDQFADGHLNAGIALAELGRWPEAVESYTRAIKLPRLTAPDTAHVNLGLALLNVGRYEEAERVLRFAVNLEPQMEAAWYHLGVALVTMGRSEEAKNAFRKARELAPTSPFGEAAVQRLKALGDGG